MKRLLFIVVAVCATMCSGSAFGQLMQYWTFDSDFSNSVGSGLDGTVVGNGVAISGADSAIGVGSLQVAHDTASGDYFHIEGAVYPDYNPTKFTITTWYKFDETLGTQTTDSRNFIFETFPTWTTGAGVRDDGAGNRDIECYFDGIGSDASAVDGPVVSDGAWHHLAMVYDYENGIDLYYDGALAHSLAAPPLSQPISGINIGNHRDGNGGRNWQGYIDDFAVYNGTLDAAGVAGLYDKTLTPQTVSVAPGPPSPNPIPTSPLQAYWTFDEGYSSEVNNAFYQGIPRGGEYTSIGSEAGEFIKGSGALKLDSGSESGNGTFVQIAREVADPARDKQITVSAWYKYSDISEDGSDGRNFIWESPPLYSLSYALRDSSGTRDGEWYFDGLANDTTGPVVNADEWYHVVMVYDAEVGLVQYYHNGALVDQVEIDGEIPAMTGFNIGNHRDGNGDRDFDGYIDDVAVYHGVLLPGAVAGLYNGTYTPLTVPVAATIPEPSTAVLLLLSLVALGVTRRR